jgi:hypothetical protein
VVLGLELLEDRITPSHGAAGTTLTLSPGSGTFNAVAGTSYGPLATFTASGASSYSWSESGSLDGMTFSGSGATATISGTPIATDTGSSFTVTVLSGKTKTSHTYTLVVAPGAVTHLVVNAPTSATAGSGFSVTVLAEDCENNVVTSVNGAVSLTCGDGQAVYPGAVTIAAGKATTTVTLNTPDYVTLTGCGLGVTGTSGGINVVSSSADWFAQNMPDAGLQNLARTDFTRDGSITYSDMVGLLNQAVSEGTVSSAILSSLQALVSSSGASYLQETGIVQNLGYKLVDGDPSNQYFQGSTALSGLSSSYALQVGTSSSTLNMLTEKWFLGEDHPIIDTQYWGTTGYALSASRALYGSSGAPQYTDVYQGEEGDCWLIASFCTAANTTNTTWGQTAIEGQFIDQGAIGMNGAEVWTVRFYENGVAQYVTVDNYFPGNNGVFMFANFYQSLSSSSAALWVALDEKAYAQLSASGWNSRPSTNSYASLNGGWASTALPLITGHTTTNSGAFGSETAFIAAIQSGTLLTMASWSTNYGFVASHDYAVISVSGSGSTALFQLYNPWGSSEPPAITWAQLTQSGDFTLDGDTKSVAGIDTSVADSLAADMQAGDRAQSPSYLAESPLASRTQGAVDSGSTPYLAGKLSGLQISSPVHKVSAGVDLDYLAGI